MTEQVVSAARSESVYGGGAIQGGDGSDALSLWDWRRRVADLYGAVRQSEPQAGWARWRHERDALFRDHPQSPLRPRDRQAFAGLPIAPYDPGLRFLVAAEAVPDLSTIEVQAGRDGTVSLRPLARTRGLSEALGGELTLYWIGGYGGGVFLPFRDATSGDESYGGGRYLLDTIKGADLGQAADGRVILDFNFSYNPSCSYSDEWVCPLPPAENTLPAAIRAGEGVRARRR